MILELFAEIIQDSAVKLTSFFSFEYLVIFLPVVIILYALSPGKAKKYILLLFSYVFYVIVNGGLTLFLLFSTVCVFAFSKLLESIKSKRAEALKSCEKDKKKEIKAEYQKRMRSVLIFAIIIHIGILVVLKYSGFFAYNINSVLSLCKIEFSFIIPDFALPLGISFFSLQAVSYLTDVYRGTEKADSNFFRVALFLGFFPQIIEGPICRYSQTAQQLWDVKQIEFENLTKGLQRVLYGMMKKVVIADRLNPFIQSVFSDHKEYGGIMVIAAAVFYSVQLYMDFSGAMDAVCGIGQIFGVVMPENFKRPFFSKSISEFWTRWHISLGTWFKDYIFYPVSMSKRMKTVTSAARKKIGSYYGPLVAGSIALFCVWLNNGLWHGSAWSYIFFGMYHFALILLGNITAPLSKKVLHKLRISSENKAYLLFRIARTCGLVVIGELFFRADGLKKGLSMFFSIFTDFRLPEMSDGFLGDFRLSFLDLGIVFVVLAVILVISILNEKGYIIRDLLQEKNVVVRWTAIIAMIVVIVVFGAYGDGYVPVDPIYANF